ncbi:PLP-dependent aminotransferase family protein [Polaribacter sp. Hel1_85]|uniref:MocR-like pyridoxine biosynthesis transcription factor PdxR n=1 Tax=Polaribacter sp. Hel1_85 TaxID=1250005 RepID=UPI00052B8A8F|nr:PLP-dependent aminotransferase family protein [Polaribacter sp. Hel1_85]KGL63025.1 transcriptional regulator, GntR family [Polaribacter sp. Hel1_85]
MFPFTTSFQLDRKSKQALYLQLSNQFIVLIKDRKLMPETKLPGSRTLSELLNVHRKTVVACYEELLLQGWVESIPKKGTFINANLPELHQQEFLPKTKVSSKNIGFQFYKDKALERKTTKKEGGFMYLNDGVSDARLTPTEDIARTYRRICGKKEIYKEMSYGSLFGNEKLRITLADYLNKTRGLHINKDNVLITRGSQMGIYLSSKLLLKEGDVIVVGQTNYGSADTNFLQRTTNLVRVSVDENGLVTDEIEQICKKKSIKAVYVTSHHHHPTTVTLSAERRIHLLNLAKKYSFAIIEDDYDYDFNYNHSPILPLASHDINGNVIYIGSVCKTVAPVFRIGYVVASKEFVNEAANQRRFIDRQGDALLELAFEDFIKSGDLDRHIKKVMKVYKTRRDLFCQLLKEYFSDVFSFETPKGGMAVWVTLNKKYSWKSVAEIAKKHQLEIGEWQRYDLAKLEHNSIRMGFATYNEEEVHELISRLFKMMKEVKGY